MRKALIRILIALFVLAAAVLLYIREIFYSADASAAAGLESDAAVTVSVTDYGWYFDGPSKTDVLVFYPGAGVEETAYAPLLHLLAAEGMDACLVKMPLRLAVFGGRRAYDVIGRYEYEHNYIGGHSLGGAIAGKYASEHSEELSGVIMLASYLIDSADDTLRVVSVYGTNDGVLNIGRLVKSRALSAGIYQEMPIEGGNHAQFGNYGRQLGDGEAQISRDEQQRITVDFIMQCIGS